MFQNPPRIGETVCRHEFAGSTLSRATITHPLHLEQEAQP
jgi:hypothetical protein